ncbi:MAG: DUF3553 domain-containing protein [Phycisphaerales bacterium]|nr:DUF3553 domain-containing protein [Phycisphaerales bacterium]
MDQFERGSHVRHVTRPEWGAGLIEKAEPVSRDGVDAQRLSIRFTRAGLKHLLTSHARLEVIDPAELLPAGRDEAMRRLITLAERVTDPFTSALRRLEAILAEYRFADQGPALLDWAAAQTGLADPLELLHRHDLESAWPRYRDARHEQLRRTLEELRRTPPANPAELAAIIGEAPETGRNALQQMHARR